LLVSALPKSRCAGGADGKPSGVESQLALAAQVAPVAFQVKTVPPVVGTISPEANRV
jgi:hypothetical protein